jgi:ABC-type antimicrobial peptide transport system permease subunit
VALVLAVVGVYGLKAVVVSRRTREIAIRLVLGATNRGVLLMIVREGLVLTAIGLVVGLAAAIGMARVLSSLLYGVSATDPVVFVGAMVTLAVAAFVASYLPARRATELTPAAALRAE